MENSFFRGFTPVTVIPGVPKNLELLYNLFISKYRSLKQTIILWNFYLCYDTLISPLAQRGDVPWS